MQRFLAQLEGTLFQGYYAKLTSCFSKKILIEQAELDRLQQQQLRDHSPELHAMARLHNKISNIMASKKLSAKERLNLISDFQIRFDKLKKETGVLSVALLAQAAFEPTPPGPAGLPNVLAEKGIGQYIALDKDEEKQDEQEENGED